MSKQVFTGMTQQAEQTQAIAATLAKMLEPGMVVRLSGEMGAGKTQFVRGLAAGLGLNETTVSSPSFALVKEYWPEATGAVLVHVDAWRLESPAMAEGLGLEEALVGAVMAIEWPEKIQTLDLPEHWHLHLVHASEGRSVTVSCTEAVANQVGHEGLATLKQQLENCI